MSRHDQAATLRSWMEPAMALVPARARPAAPRTQVIAIASGKGGVGKTSLVANLAVAMARLGRRVLAIDGDLGLANLDLMLGVVPQHSILEAVQGALPLSDILVEGPAGVHLLPASTGHFDLANLSAVQRDGLLDEIAHLSRGYDSLLIDTAAGLGHNVLAFAGAAAHVVVVVTPEPSSMSDAYALIKVLLRQAGVQRVQLVANRVSSPREGEALFARLAELVDRFLASTVEYLGTVVHDPEVARAARARLPLLIRTPEADAALGISAIAQRVQALGAGQGAERFWQQLLVAHGGPA